MAIDFIASPNCAVRRRSITAIVIHYTAAMSIDSTIRWFADSKSQVSAHYVIGRDGRIVQMVADSMVAWHAGRSSLNGETGVNSFSIGIELVGTDRSGFPEPQLVALDLLLTMLVARYRIPPERIVGHADIAPGRKIDPDGTTAQFDWARTRQVAVTTLASLATTDPAVPTDPTHAPDHS